MALTTTDPFTLIYQTLWTAFTSYAPWVTAMGGSGKDGNRIRFDLVAKPPKMDLTIQPGDAPLVAMMPGAFQWRPYHFDASAADMTLSFPLVIVGDSLKVQRVNEVKWATLRALVNAGQYLGIPYLVRSMGVRNGNDDMLSPAEWKANHQRMMTVLTVDVVATIKREAVLVGEYPTATPT